MSLKRPALDPKDVEPRSRSGYPEPFRSRVLPRERRALGDALCLTKIGVNLTTLPPGKESSMRHHRTLEDEFVFVLEGEVVLVTDAGEQILGAGSCAGFPAGARDGHHLVNRSDRPARYLEISNRDADDSAEYPDVDLALRRGPGGDFVFTHEDGSSYSPEDRPTRRLLRRGAAQGRVRRARERYARPPRVGARSGSRPTSRGR